MTEQPRDGSDLLTPKDMLEARLHGVDLYALSPDARRLILSNWHESTGGDSATVTSLSDEHVKQFLREAQGPSRSHEDEKNEDFDSLPTDEAPAAPAVTDVPEAISSGREVGEQVPKDSATLSRYLDAHPLSKGKKLPRTDFGKYLDERRRAIIDAIDASSEEKAGDDEISDLIDQVSRLRNWEIEQYATMLRVRTEELNGAADPEILPAIAQKFLDSYKLKCQKKAAPEEKRRIYTSAFGKDVADGTDDQEIESALAAHRRTLYQLHHPQSVQRPSQPRAERQSPSRVDNRPAHRTSNHYQDNDELDHYEISKQVERIRQEDPERFAERERQKCLEDISTQLNRARKAVEVGKTGTDEEKIALIQSMRDARDLSPIRNLDGSFTTDRETLDRYFEDFFAHQAERAEWLRGRRAEIKGDVLPQVSQQQEAQSDVEQEEVTENTYEASERQTNGEMSDQVADLLDGRLVVDKNDRVRYGAGMTAARTAEGGSKRVDGQFENASQLRDIVAFQDQIREGLADRGAPAVSPENIPVDTELDGDGSDKDVHSYEHEAPAEGVVPEEESLGDTPVFTAAFVDRTKAAYVNARDAAEAKRRDELNQGGRMRRFIRNLWKGENAIAGAYIFEKYKKLMLDQIVDTQDVLVHESDDIAARHQAEQALIDRYTSDYDDEAMLHKSAGEKRKELDDTSEFGRGLKELIRRYASGEIADADALNEEKKRLVAELRERGDPDLLGEGLVMTDDFLSLAQNVKAAVEHGHSLERVLEQMKLYTGVAAEGVRSEAHLTRVDKVVERLRESRLTTTVSPTTISMAAAIGLGITRAGRGSLLTALGVTVAPGVLGGGFAALRENQRVKVERALHSREMAQGKEYTAGDTRREEMEAARYDTVSAQAMTDELNGLFAEGEELTPERIQAAYQSLAAADTRIRLSDRRKIDYISYSSATSVETERLALNIARARAKVQLAGHLRELPQSFRDSLGITDAMSVDEALMLSTATLESLSDDATAKDAAFAKLKRARVAKAAAVGFATSLIVGTATQEALAAAMPSYDGLAEHLLHPEGISQGGHQTVLEGLVHGQHESTTVDTILPSDTYKNYTIAGQKDILQLPSNYSLTTHSDGSITVTAPDGSRIVENLPVNTSGTIDPAQIKAELQAHGISVEDKGTHITVPHTETKSVSIQEYNTQHKASLTKITRDFWDDNNTSRYDKNELKLWWGGADNKGVGANGSVMMDVSHMTQGGSYHGLEHTDWSKEAAEGHLKLAVSGSRGTQSEVYMVDVKPDGTIEIPAGSPVSAFFSKDANGQMQFHGAYAEVVKVNSAADGITHVTPLATEVGDQSVKTITTEVQTTETKYVPQLKLTPPAIEHVTTIPGKSIEGFGGPAIVTRKPLESLVRRRRGGEYYVSGGQQYLSSERRSMLEAERSPRLKIDSSANLHPKEELDWYRSELERRRGAEGLRALESTIESTPELRDVSETLETIVTIPVGAAFEADNIFKTLSLYGQQDPESLKHTVILLNVNWLNTAAKDPKKRAKINKTFSEIERARIRFPNLRIAVLKNEYNEQDVTKTGGVIGYAASDMVDAALLTVQKAMERGTLDPGREVGILRNDADMDGMSHNYLARLQKALRDFPETDIFRGMTRFGARNVEKYPGWSLVSDLATKLVTQSVASGGINTGGANVLIRASTFAAAGGLGDVKKIGSGAGSDDTNMGLRIAEARTGSAPEGAQYSGSSGSFGPTSVVDSDRRIIRHVAGANVDTNAERLIPLYLRGKWWQSAWRTDIGTFNKGAGGYGERNQKTGNRLPKRESFKGDRESDTFRRLEGAITYEIQHMSEQGQHRLLASLFQHAPAGSYQLEQTPEGARFRLTKVGRGYVSEQMSRDRRTGRAGYAERKLRGLYGTTSLNSRPALVSPVTS